MAADRPVRVKICGLTRVEDAAVAVAAGASYLGVVFAGGPRVVTPDQARKIVAVSTVGAVFGVFGSQSVEQILRIRDATAISGAQLHGSYTAEAAARLRLAGLRIWRVVRIADDTDLELVTEARTASDGVLVEPRIVGALGGTGSSLSLALAREARDRLQGHPMILAGGLTPESVGEAVRAVRPDAVDVSSGVEQIIGIKDHSRIARFVEATVGDHATR